jgi:hypothetical protein
VICKAGRHIAPRDHQLRVSIKRCPRPAIAPQSPMELLTLPLDNAAIEKILPRRYPFLLVDRITKLEGSDEMTRLIARLRELVAALDRRIPRPERPNEDQIARDSAALKNEALARIGDLT